MKTLTISLPEESMARLKEKAERLRVKPEELIQASLEEWLSRPDEDFQRAMKHVLEKNTELYHRLASA